MSGKAIRHLKIPLPRKVEIVRYMLLETYGSERARTFMIRLD
jgi:hypothetical protein